MYLTAEQMDQRLEQELVRAQANRDHMLKVAKAAGVEFIEISSENFDPIDLSGYPVIH
jgi:hypothetical protein